MSGQDLRAVHRTRNVAACRLLADQTISTLRDLESEGLVVSQRAGKTDLFSLNERSSAASAVQTHTGMGTRPLCNLGGIFEELWVRGYSKSGRSAASQGARNGMIATSTSC